MAKCWPFVQKIMVRWPDRHMVLSTIWKLLLSTTWMCYHCRWRITESQTKSSMWWQLELSIGFINTVFMPGIVHVDNSMIEWINVCYPEMFGLTTSPGWDPSDEISLEQKTPSLKVSVCKASKVWQKRWLQIHLTSRGYLWGFEAYLVWLDEVLGLYHCITVLSR